MTTLATIAYLTRLALWGLGVALLFGLPIRTSLWLSDRFSREAAPEARHRLACAHLIALAVTPLLVIVVLHALRLGLGPVIEREPPTVWIPVSQRLDVLLIPISVWGAGCLLIALRLASDVRRLARVRAAPAPAGLVEEVRLLALRAGLNRKVAVRIADVGVPQAAWHWRPVILVPVDLLEFPAAEREAVLLHELAHIARTDFTANLLQRLALLALWFQPVAWSLYRRIAREREAACDDRAVANGAARVALGRALVRLAGRHAGQGLAMGAPGDGALAWRLERLISAPASAASTPRRVWLASVAVLALAISGATLLGAKDPELTDLFVASQFGPVVAVNASDQAGSFGLRLQQGRVIEAAVGGERLGPERIHQNGERVTLAGRTAEPISLQVLPEGRVRWDPRKPRTEP